MREKTLNPQTDYLSYPLHDHINLNHPLILLSELIDWKAIEALCGQHFPSKKGRAATASRLIAGLLYLQHTYDLSDEAVVWGWVENVYWQAFTGETYLQTKPPIDPSSLTRWRKRLGISGMEVLLKATLEASFKSGALQAKQCQTVLVDTTVMPKAVAYPTDSRLLEKARIHLVKAAENSGIHLRQNYNRVAPKLVLQIGRYAHAKQFKRMNRQLKKLKNIVGRIKRDIERQWQHINQKGHSVLEPLILKAQRAIDQNKQSKNKLYAWHAPEV